MKAHILTAGVAVVDIVMNLDEMPTRPEKYRAKDAAIVGGGCGGNAAVAISRLGGQSSLAARLGDDPIADMIVSGLVADNVNCDLVKRFSGSRSSFSSIFIDAFGERQIVNFRDAGLPESANWLRESVPVFDAALVDNRWTDGALALMEIAKARGKPGVLDAEAPILDTERAMQMASHVIFAAQGLREYTGLENLTEGLDLAWQKLGAFVAVTDGPSGVFWRDDKNRGHVTGFKVDVVDTLGAGDVWHGAFTLGLGEGMPLAEAIRFSHAAAALKCVKPGGREGAPTRSEIESFLGSNPECN